MMRPEPPLQFRGLFAEAMYERVIDHVVCHCCCERIDPNSGWGCFGDVVRHKNSGSVVRFIRLCEDCFSIPYDAMKGMKWGWK